MSSPLIWNLDVTNGIHNIEIPYNPSSNLMLPSQFKKVMHHISSIFYGFKPTLFLETLFTMRAILLLTLLPLSLAFTPKFQDVTIAAGINIRPNGVRKLLKYGGPTIADLDRDGHYDLIFVHHGSNNPEAYFNNGDGTFTKGAFGLRHDVHSITPFLLPKIKDFFVTLVPGGGAGKHPNPPIVWRAFQNRSFVRYDDRLGLDHWKARGRTVVFMPLRKNRLPPDALFLNGDSSPERCPGCTDGQFDAYAFRRAGRNPIYRPKILKGFNPASSNSQGMAIDPDGDRTLKILSWRALTIHEITGYFTAKDVTERFLGENSYLSHVTAVVEIDFDNDGDFDLYVARDKNGNRNSTRGRIYPDFLLENRDGQYVNVGVEAGIPQDTISRGVTAGDFNNDGWMDLYVSVLREAEDVLLLNNGNGTFRKHDIGIGKQGAWGDNALAVDYDNDGRLDLVRSEGDFSELRFGGQFRILKNVPTLDERRGNYVKVRVGQLGEQISQHAVVIVIAEGKRLMQRVGQVGVQTPHSYFDILHFGIGKATKVLIKVTWLNGETRLRQVEAGDTAEFGSF